MPRDTEWRVHGTIVPTPTSREDATRFANLAASRRSTWGDLALNIFSDASFQNQSSVGGYAVVHRPLIPSDEGGSDEGNDDHDGFIEAAWPIDPLPDSNLAEMLAIAKSMAVAIQQVKGNRAALMGKTITITIFRNSVVSLGVLNGRKLRDRLWLLVFPVARFIREQSRLLEQLGPTVNLVLRWMPGHGHRVLPHMRADRLARSAGLQRLSYTNVARNPNFWEYYSESPTFRWLKPTLLRAVQEAVSIWPRLHRSLRPQHPVPLQERWNGALRDQLDLVMPVSELGKKNMPTAWADANRVLLCMTLEQNTMMTIEAAIPVLRSNDHIFINDGFGANCAAMRLLREGQEMGQEAWGKAVEKIWPYKLEQKAD
ncbi:hypothetical protein B0I37DRAFT_432961 [Chaetomium sp. MPI-CAGE-AT-0009]|nr:hypothetical protein B0I37DRAFT_432961 [Chaetomium sp. MPI-CAGE-AT-0009]